jgi:hypothetical protein
MSETSKPIAKWDRKYHVHCVSTQASGGVGDWISERQECHWRWPSSVERKEISLASTSGPAVMRNQPIRCAPRDA